MKLVREERESLGSSGGNLCSKDRGKYRGSISLGDVGDSVTTETGEFEDSRNEDKLR